MTSPHRDIINAVLTAIQTTVPGADAWTPYVEEPVRHDPNGHHLAVWFEGDTVNSAHNTTGSIDTTDLYGIRYWERATSKPRRIVDEDDASTIEGLMDAVCTVIVNGQVGKGTSYSTDYRGGRKFIGQDIGSAKGDQIVGFEIAFTARRTIQRTG